MKFLLKVFLLILISFCSIEGFSQNGISFDDPKTNAKDTIFNAQTYLEGQVTIKATKFDDPLGNPIGNPKIGLWLRKTAAYPEIKIIVRGSSAVEHDPYMFIDTNKDAKFDDDIDSEIENENIANGVTHDMHSAAGVTALWSIQTSLDYLASLKTIGINWVGVNNTVDLPVVVAIANDNIDHEVFLESGQINLTSKSFPDVNVPEFISSASIQLIAHEFAHMIYNYNISASNNDTFEGKAVNEAFADILGISVSNFHRAKLGLPPEWKIGNMVLNNGYCARNIQNPKDVNNYLSLKFKKNISYPTTWGILPVPPEVESYPHYYSTMMSHWFYLLSEGGQGTNDHQVAYTVTGIGSQNAFKLFWGTMLTHLDKNSKREFHDVMVASVKSAIQNFGFGSQAHASVLEAWKAVGLINDGDKLLKPIQTKTYYEGVISFAALENTVPGNWTPFKSYYEFAEKGLGINLKLHFSSSGINLPILDLDKDGMFMESEIHSKHVVDAYMAVHATSSYFIGNIFEIKEFQNTTLHWPVNGSDLPFNVPSIESRSYRLLQEVFKIKAGGTPPIGSENNIIRHGFSFITAKMIKDFVSKAPSWKFAEQGGPDGYDFKKPTGPIYFHGKNWSNAVGNSADEINGKIYAKWYELLCDGGLGFQDGNKNNPSYFLMGIGKENADKIVQAVWKKFTLATGFSTLMSDVEIAINELFQKDPTLMANAHLAAKTAFFAIGLGPMPQTDYAPSGNKANNAPMWPTVLEESSFFEVENWEFEVSNNPGFINSTNVIFQDGVQIIPKTAILFNYLQYVHPNSKKKYGSTEATFNGGETIYWRSRPTKIKNINDDIIPIGDFFNPDNDATKPTEAPWGATHKLTTENFKVKNLNTKSLQPWPAEFSWGLEIINKDNTVPEVDEFRIQMGVLPFPSDLNELKSANKIKRSEFVDQQGWSVDNNAIKWKRDLQKEKGYRMVVQAWGGKHSLYHDPARGKVSDHIDFTTKIPQASPADAKLVDVPPYGFEIAAKDVSGASSYEYMLGNSTSLSPMHLLPNLNNGTGNPYLITNQLADAAQAIYNDAVKDGQVYHWGVRPLGPVLNGLKSVADGTIETGSHKGTGSFRVKLGLLKPGLVSPDNDFKVYGIYDDKDNPVKFTWNAPAAAKGAVTYTIEIMDDKGNQLPLTGNTGLTSTTFQISNKIFYDYAIAHGFTNLGKFKWRVLTEPPANTSLPKVPSEDRNLTLGPDRTKLVSPGAPCLNNDCNQGVVSGAPPLVSLVTGNNQITVVWEKSKFAPFGYALSFRELNGLIIHNFLVVAGTPVPNSPNLLSHTITSASLKHDTKYTWFAGAAWMSQPLNGEVTWPTNFTFMFQTEPPPGPPFEIILLESTTNDLRLVLESPDPDNLGYGLSYAMDPSQVQYYYDGPYKGYAPTGTPPYGITTNPAVNTVDVIAFLQQPVPGKWLLSVELPTYGDIDPCGTTFTIIVRKNGQVIDAKDYNLTCEYMQNNYSVDFDLTID